ncbi:MAG: retropepsin-like domain-containing protein [Saprospiraceae bacterium]|nr:retropepsin-like domain-containing protein [Saprospiraceae bacterium]
MLVFSNELKGQFTTYHENGNGEKVEIPFEYINGFIVVDIIFEKVLPFKFILDTGAENTILLKRTYTDLLKTPCRKRIKLMGSDLSKEVYATICNSTYIQMINLQPVRHNVIVLEEDFLYLEEYTGTKIDGILGVSFFRDMVVKLDYKMKILTLYRPEKFLAKDLKIIRFLISNCTTTNHI